MKGKIERSRDFLSATPDQLRAMIELVDDLPKSHVRWYISWVRKGRTVTFTPREILISMQAAARAVREERKTR